VFTIVLLPLTILLVAITFGSLSIHQQAMRSMVGERDARAVQTAAGALNAQVDNRVKEVQSMAELLSANPSQPLTTTLSSLSFLMPDFDAGVAFNPQGELVTVGSVPQVVTSWSADNQNWQTEYSSLAADPGKLMVTQPSGNAAAIGLISARLANNELIVGAFSINQLLQSTVGAMLPSDGQLSIWLVGPDGQILYDAGGFSDEHPNHPGVMEALQGKTGTAYVDVAGDEHVTAYSPVPAAGWALITEESWEAVSTPILRTSQITPLVLVPAVFIMLLALWFGATQVVRPLRALEAKTSTLAEVL
jgi:hypothetical protein